MSMCAAAVFLCLILLFPDLQSLQARDSRNPERLALLVGISSYSRGRDAGKDWMDLNGARDVAFLKKTLIEKSGFRSEDILVLTDEKATHQGIIRAFQDHLIARAGPGDTVLFHFSGHGQLMKDSTGRKLTGKDECFVPYDYGEQGVRVLENNPRLGALEIKGLLGQLCGRMKENGKVKGDILVVLDTCHSGTGTRGKGRMKIRGRGWNTEYDGPEPKAPSSAGMTAEPLPDYVFFAACKPAQSAMEDPDSRMGILTESLIKALEKARPDSTYRDIFEKIRNAAAEMDIDQEPQAEGNLDKILFSGTIKPAVPYLRARPIDEGGMVELPAGCLHGVTKGSRYALYNAEGPFEESNRIADLLITSVETDTSRGAIEGNAVPGDRLAMARAVEKAHNYQSLLKVYAEGALLKAVKGLMEQNIIEGTAEDYDIRLCMKNGAAVLQRKDGSTIREISPSRSIDDQISSSLLKEWRRHLLMTISGDGLEVGIRLIRVSLDVERREERGEPEAFICTQGENPAVSDGDFISFEVRNSSKKRVFINILHCSQDGEITPLFPDPGTALYQDITQNDRDSIPADGRWYRIPANVERSLQSAFTWKARITGGQDYVKLIATPARLDLSPLLRDDDSGARAVADIFDPFSLLLINKGIRPRKTSDSSVNRNAFGTAGLFFTVKKGH